MICTNCGDDGVENSANGNTFWYCRTCKVEIMPEAPKTEPETNNDEWPFWGISNANADTNYYFDIDNYEDLDEEIKKALKEFADLSKGLP